MLARPGLTSSQAGRTDAELNTLIATSGRTDAEVNSLIANHTKVVRIDDDLTDLDATVFSKQDGLTFNTATASGTGNLTFANSTFTYTPASFSGLQPAITVTELATDSSYPGGRLHKAPLQTGGGEVLQFTPGCKSSGGGGRGEATATPS